MKSNFEKTGGRRFKKKENKSNHLMGLMKKLSSKSYIKKMTSHKFGAKEEV